MGTYYRESVVRVTGTFTNAAGASVDPTVIYFAYKDPNGVVTTNRYGVDPQPLRSGAGVYTYDIQADISGMYSYKFYSTGTGKAAVEQQFVVSPEIVV